MAKPPRTTPPPTTTPRTTPPPTTTPRKNPPSSTTSAKNPPSSTTSAKNPPPSTTSAKNPPSTTPPKGDKPPKPGKAWKWDNDKNKWVKPPKPKGDYSWDDDKGWIKDKGPEDPPDDKNNPPGKAWKWDNEKKKWVKPPKPEGNYDWDDDKGWVPRGGPDDRPPSPGDAWVWDDKKKKWVKPPKPEGDYDWDDDEGWVKDKGGGGGSGLTEKEVREIVRDELKKFKGPGGLTEEAVKKLIQKEVKDAVTKDIKNIIKKEIEDGLKEKGFITKAIEKMLKKFKEGIDQSLEDVLEMSDSGSGSNNNNQVEENEGNTEPVVRNNRSTIEVPRSQSTANIVVPNDSERINMPNIDKKITKAVDRLTLQITTMAKEFIEGGIDYNGIDYIAQNEIVGEDGSSYYSLPDYNAAEETELSLAEERAFDISETINALLFKGDKNMTKYYNYKEYIDLFELRYNGSGDPYYRFTIEMTGDVTDDLSVYLAEEYSD